MATVIQRVVIAGVMLAVCVMGRSGSAQAHWENLYPGFFQPAKPGVFDVFAFGGGYGNSKYGALQEGIQAEQSITNYLGIVGRATGYQLWVGNDFDNPLVPGTGHQGRLNFGRLQGGVEFAVYPGTRLFVLGGHDVGDSDATVIEGDLSSWWMTHSRHPINFAFSAVHDYQNHVTSAEMDSRVVAASTENYLFTAGVGGAIYQGGEIDNAQGQGGLDFGVYFRKWGFGLNAQSGYGTAQGFGQLSFIKQWDFLE